MDRHGYFSFGTGNDYSTKVARAAKRLIVEVNQNMPRVDGAGAELHVSEVDAIVENHVPLLELPSRGASVEDEVISRTIADLVPDGACLQMGVGALPNLVCAELEDRKRPRRSYRSAEPGPCRSRAWRGRDQSSQGDAPNALAARIIADLGFKACLSDWRRPHAPGSARSRLYGPHAGR
jgi:hypothetical protein